MDDIESRSEIKTEFSGNNLFKSFSWLGENKCLDNSSVFDIIIAHALCLKMNFVMEN